ncbi:MAG: O-acetyl-ADP-ribose deacetylase [Actinomycetota bacterium]|nr:O-acetyl-ADP-ribose deacetylase [Actinomycetota bacterium]
MRIEAVLGDITEQDVDAIVNAANSGLLGGGGVDAAIHAAAGPRLVAACQRLRDTDLPDGLPTGQAVATPGFDLPSRYVIHTVGPVHDEHPDGGPALLASCHLESLACADRLGVASVAFPAISCGVYGWTAPAAAPIAIRAVREHARLHPDSSVRLVRFVLFSPAALDAWHTALGQG